MMSFERPSWPNGAKCAVALTFDNFGESFDLLRHGHAGGANADGVYAPRRGIERVLDLLARYSVPATFFVEGWNAKKYADLAREIVKQGHEIGGHGWMHEAWSELPPKRERDLILRTTTALSDILGQAPTGWRAPSGLTTEGTLGFLREAGYLKLTAPRIVAGSAGQYRRHGLDGPIFVRSNRTLERELQGGKALTRTALTTALKEADIQTDNLGYMLLLMRAELDELICSGPRRGKQFTYMLLDERAPAIDRFNRDQALRELAARYFTSHGPATPHDFSWWSGLTVGDARHAIEMLGTALERIDVGGRPYFVDSASGVSGDASHSVLLLPIYDEAIIAYQDRSAVLRRLAASKTPLPENIVFNHTILIDGQVVGIWKRSASTRSVTIEPTLFTDLTQSELREIDETIERHAAFFDLTLAAPDVESNDE